MGSDETSLGQAGEWSHGPTVPPPPVAVEPPPPPPAPPSRRSRTSLIVAAAILLALGVGIGVTIGVTGSGKKSPNANTSPAHTVLAPTDLKGSVDLITVSLTWQKPPGGLQVAGYNLYRDGQLVGSFAASTTAYADIPQPGRLHTYQVEATGSGLTSSRVEVQVYVPAPSLALARLAGDFNVKAKLERQTGFRSYPSPFTLGWHFIPKCATGACDVAWSDLSTKSFRAVLRRHGFTYRGTDTGDFRSVCGQTHVQSKLTITFQVVRAKVADGEWRATRLVGTIVQTDTPQLGCVGSSATLSITASLLLP
jgi:hypothetical protein